MKNIIKPLLILSIVLFQSAFLNAQNKYGKVSLELLEQTSYDKDTTAAALITLKEGQTVFTIDREGGFQFEQEIKVQIKIFKTEGLDWCNQDIAYYYSSSFSKEELQGPSGCTYNLENGKIVKTNLSKSNIFEEETGTNVRLCKFTMPAAKVGSVIEYKYTIVSSFLRDLRDFKFQENIPIQEVKYNVQIPEYLTYNVNMLGYESVLADQKNITASIIFKGGGSHRCTTKDMNFSRKDMPAIKKEGYVWTMDDYVTKVSFELQSVYIPGAVSKSYTSNWENIDENLLASDYYGGNLKRANMFKDEIQKGDLTLEKAIDIQNMIKSRVTWDGKNRAYPTNLSKVYKEGTGNSADMNLLLYNALKAAGYKAYPVLLSTRDNGVIPIANPSASSFNYLIVAVDIDTLRYYTDASAKYGSWNILPNLAQVPRARIVSKEYWGWVDLTNVTPYRSAIMTATSLSEKGQSCKNTLQYRDGAAFATRQAYNTADNESKFIEDLEKKYGGEITDFVIKDADKNDKPLLIEYVLNKPQSLGDEHLYIDAIPYKIVSSNPFQSETRIYPVMFDNNSSQKYVASLDVPDGYEIEELPKSENISLNDNDMSLIYKVAAVENKVQIQATLQINKTLYLPNEYETLKDFYAKLVQKSNAQIVLKKKSEQITVE